MHVKHKYFNIRKKRKFSTQKNSLETFLATPADITKYDSPINYGFKRARHLGDYGHVYIHRRLPAC